MSEFAAEAPTCLPPPAEAAVDGTSRARARAGSPHPDSPRPDSPRPDSPHPEPPAPGRAGSPGPAGLRLPVAVALAVASGLALWSAFPSRNWWPLAPVAIGGLALAGRGQRARRAALIGLVGGLAFLVPHLHWSGIYVGLLPWFALASAEAAFVAGASALLPRAWRAPGGSAGTVLAITGLWVAQEALRSRVPFGGFPWGRAAFSQADSPLLGYAAIGGAPLVSAAVAAVGACLAVVAAHLLDHGAFRRPGGLGAARRAWRLPVLALAGAAVVLGGGLAVPRPTGSSRSIEVAAVQGNVPQAGLEFNAQRRAVLDDHVRGTELLAQRVAAGGAPQPDVVIWPENSSDIDPLRNVDAHYVISVATDDVKAPVLVGAVLQEPADHLSNASIVWGPTGSPASGPGQRYVKRHPAPFAEYIPYRSFFRHFSDKVDLVSHDFAAGRTVGVLSAGGARLGDVICFEVAYDDLVRDTVTAGADLLVVQTNNATFGYSDESVQQLAMSRLRAVESGRAVVHISTVGVSGLIAPDGRLVQRSGHFDAQVLQARLPLRTQQTVATRVGAWPEILLALAGVLLALLAGARRTSRPRRPGTTPTTHPGDSAGPAGQESRP